MTNVRYGLFILFAIVTAFVPLQTALPVPVLQLVDSNGMGSEVSVIVPDNSSLDSNPLPGIITFSGAVGDLNGTFTGQINSVTPSMHLFGTLAAQAVFGDLTALLSAPGLGPVDPHTPAVTDQFSIASTGILNFTHSTWIDLDRLTHQESFGGHTFKGTAFNAGPSFALNSVFSLSQSVVIAQDPHVTADFDSNLSFTPVPDNGGTIWLFLSSLAVLALFVSAAANPLKLRKAKRLSP